MKKILQTLSVLSVLSFIFQLEPVFAHVLETDGSIGAVLHIDPEDDPVAGEQTGFFFDFKDKEGKFKIGQCQCTFSVSEGGKEIYSAPMDGPSALFTFPKKDVYLVKASGKGQTNNAFQPFSLVYTIRVERDSAKAATATTDTATVQAKNPNWLQTHVVHLIGGGFVLGFFLFALIKQNLQKKGGE